MLRIKIETREGKHMYEGCVVQVMNGEITILEKSNYEKFDYRIKLEAGYNYYTEEEVNMYIRSKKWSILASNI